MLLQAADSCVLLIDMQEKVLPLIIDHEMLVANCQWIIKLADRLQIPFLISEQCSNGTSPTVAPLNQFITDDNRFEKIHFSCTSESDCLTRILSMKRQQIILIGIETHVCILQSAIELRMHGKEVYVVADATSARQKIDIEKALQRMRSEGIHIITKEMVFFEWIRKAETDLYNELVSECIKNS
jgi:nicotinamidase-related amidase